MRNRLGYILIACLTVVVCYGKKQVSLKVDTRAIEGQQSLLSTGETCNNQRVLKGDSATSAVRFYGYDKPFSSNKESVFLASNLPEDTIIRVSAIIEYSTVNGKLLHKRPITFETELIPEESVRLLFDTWDVTHTFYFHRTPPSRKQNLTPYQVKILPLEVTVKQ